MVIAAGINHCFRSDRLPADLTFFQELFLDEEAANYALPMTSEGSCFSAD